MKARTAMLVVLALVTMMSSFLALSEMPKKRRDDCFRGKNSERQLYPLRSSGSDCDRHLAGVLFNSLAEGNNHRHALS
jgi:hypothetical protein